METLSHIAAAIMLWLLGLFGAQALTYTAPSFLAPQQATIIFGGDMMFDRSIRTTIDEKGGDFIFSCIDPTLRDADMMIANLEGPITASSSVSVNSTPGGTNNFTFTFATTTAPLLYAHGIRIVNLGNNHIMNFGRAGLEQTKMYLAQAGVQYFGDPDAAEADKVLRTTIHGVPFAFVNWSDWTSDKTDHTVAQVREEAAAGRVVVVYTHWGEEYIPPIARVRELAHQFVDAGASIVIGSHPHVVQEKETYQGKEIYYSIGNFIFDQYWMPSVREGLLLKVTFDKSGVQHIEEIPVDLGRDRRTCPHSAT